ncbi:hypothetical protein QVD99_008318 [Batrachochytrium dendrobatidis]|nr:hypothetical protein QVD99_008318 [Batrachochytrium dendrobatidis]
MYWWMTMAGDCTTMGFKNTFNAYKASELRLTTRSTMAAWMIQQQSLSRVFRMTNPYRKLMPCTHGTFYTVRSFHNTITRISDTVQQALGKGWPVVALESTIITHGMPFPQNLETAIEVETIVRQHGCVPATIALLDGQLRIGLDGSDLERLAKIGLDATKTSRRDMALVLGRNLPGSTTVSGTMIAAHKAGIDVFVTGGIGGVHRGSESSMDISADLTELGRTPIAVISAGVKSILDIGRTLEYLETQGVTVVSYGDSDDFPAFYTRKSGFKSMANLTTPQECADMIYANLSLGLNSGLVIAVPIPEKDAYPHPDRLEKVIQDAIHEANQRGVRGKDITPFLLDKVKTLTGGMSLAANISLVKNNAAIGSDIARALSHKKSVEASKQYCQKSNSISSSNTLKTGLHTPLIIGGTVLDISAKFDAGSNKNEIMRTSTPGSVYQSLGGVGLNVAKACCRSGGRPRFLSAVGDDAIGKQVMSAFEDSGMNSEFVKAIQGSSTATYTALLQPDGELLAAVSDMKIHEQISIDGQVWKTIQENPPSVICVDANVSVSLLKELLETTKTLDTLVCFEPTSVVKSRKLFDLPANLISQVQIVTPNDDELVAMSNALDKVSDVDGVFKVVELAPDSDSIAKYIGNLLKAFELVIVKRGPQGVMIGKRVQSTSTGKYSCEMACLEVKGPVNHIISVTGAGDSMVGTILTGLASLPYPLDLQGTTMSELSRIVRFGMKAAELSLQSKESVSDSIKPDLFESTT